jgi:hypothetical protein
MQRAKECALDHPDTSRRTAVFILQARKGWKNEARSIFGRVVRSALGVKRWYTAPYHVDYLSEAAAQSYDLSDAMYSIQLTDRELQCLLEKLNAAFRAAGWSKGIPFDVYHD